MICIGMRVQQVILCPTCGSACFAIAPGKQQLVSVVCNNQECSDTGALLIVCRDSGTVMFTDARYTHENPIAPTRVYPAFIDGEGKLQEWKLKPKG